MSDPSFSFLAPELDAIECAVVALRNQQPDRAAALLAPVLADELHNADALRLLRLAHQQRGAQAAMLRHLQDADVLRPDDAVILNDLGGALRTGGDLPGAIAMFRRATTLSPAFTIAWHNLGVALRLDGQSEGARTAFEQALRCDPSFTASRGAMGDVLTGLGDIAGAQACYRACLGTRSQAPKAWFQLANLKTVRLSDVDLKALQRWYVNPTLNDKERVHIGYALSKALEDHEQYESAVALLTQTSRIKRAQFAWDANAFSRRVDAIAAAFARPPLSASPVDLGRETIFLVCMPRAGATLTEQILASHPEVEGGHESLDLKNVIAEESTRRGQEFPRWVAQATPEDWRRLGEDYLARTVRWRGTRTRFTDKGLENWQYVGAAAAMLPGARFVNCRRDGLETCLSCYRQLFLDGIFFSYDMTELGAFWRDYDRLSLRWRERYPERFRDHVYEDLLAEPETQIRGLLDFLGLPFDAACLQPHRTQREVRTFSSAQVRQPLRKDTARAARYGAALDPLREALRGASSIPVAGA